MLAPTSPPILAPAAKNGLSVGRAAVVIEAQDDSGQVRIVRLGTAELIVLARRPARAVVEVLQLPAATVVADQDVQLAVRSEPNHAAVVIAARRLRLIPLSRRCRRAVVLKRPQHDQVAIEMQGTAIPDEPIDAIPEKRHLEDVRRCPPRTCSRRGSVRSSGKKGSAGGAVLRQVQYRYTPG